MLVKKAQLLAQAGYCWRWRKPVTLCPAPAAAHQMSVLLVHALRV
jgi:hypothetical protein